MCRNSTSEGKLSKPGGPLVCLFSLEELFFFSVEVGKARGELKEISGVIWMLQVISGCLMLALFGCLCHAFLTRLSSHHSSVSLRRDCLVFALLASERRQLTLMKLLHLLVRVGL